MPTETYGHETDRQIEDAKASMLARMEEISRRIRDARHKIDIKAHIAAHPLPAVGIAFVVGAALGFVPGRKKKHEPIEGIEGEDVKRSIGAIIGGALVTLVLRIAKDMALRRMSSSVQTWWEQRRASAQPATEPLGAEPMVEPY